MQFEQLEQGRWPKDRRLRLAASTPESSSPSRWFTPSAGDSARQRPAGARAHSRVRDAFLGPRHLDQYVDLLRRTLARGQ